MNKFPRSQQIEVLVQIGNRPSVIIGLVETIGRRGNIGEVIVIDVTIVCAHQLLTPKSHLPFNTRSIQLIAHIGQQLAIKTHPKEKQGIITMDAVTVEADTLGVSPHHVAPIENSGVEV